MGRALFSSSLLNRLNPNRIAAAAKNADGGAEQAKDDADDAKDHVLAAGGHFFMMRLICGRGLPRQTR